MYRFETDFVLRDIFTSFRPPVLSPQFQSSIDSNENLFPKTVKQN